MGVTGLWNHLKKRQGVEELTGLPLARHVEGKTIAVDAATWLVQSRTQEQINDHPKAHLKVVFERVCHFLRMGALPVLVFDVQMPRAKAETLVRRYGWAGGSGSFKAGGPFQIMMADTRALLDAMGLPYVNAPGEAEATCALLNRAGKVDAVASDDGDALLYGARQLYKGLGLHAELKGPHGAEWVQSSGVAAALGVTDGEVEEALVALALISGADYLVDGIKSHGPARAAGVVRMLQRQEGKGARPGLLDSLREVLATPVDEVLLASSMGGCSTCTRCRHGSTRKGKHGAQGCAECETHSTKQGGNGEGGCAFLPLAVGEECACKYCSRKIERQLHLLAQAAAATDEGGSGTAAFLQRFDRARRAYKGEAASAREAVARLQKPFAWERRPDYQLLDALLQQVLGYSGQGHANVARKVLPVLLEYDAGQGGDTGHFVPTAIKDVCNRNKEVLGESRWRYTMTFRSQDSGDIAIVAAAAKGQGQGQGLQVPARPQAGCSADARRAYEQQLESLLGKVLSDGRNTLRMTLVEERFPALVRAFEAKKQAPPAKPKRGYAAVSRKAVSGMRRLESFFSSPARLSASALSHAAASSSSSSSSSAAGPFATPPPPPPRAAAPGAAAAATTTTEARARIPSPIKIEDTPPSSSSSAAPSSPPFLTPPTKRPTPPVPAAPRKAKRPGGPLAADAWLKEGEEQEEDVFGTGAVRDLGSRLIHACRPGALDEEDEDEEGDGEEGGMIDLASFGGDSEGEEGVEDEEEEDGEVEIVEEGSLPPSLAVPAAASGKKLIEIELTTP